MVKISIRMNTASSMSAALGWVEQFEHNPQLLASARVDRRYQDLNLTPEKALKFLELVEGFNSQVAHPIDKIRVLPLTRRECRELIEATQGAQNDPESEPLSNIKPEDNKYPVPGLALAA